MRTVFCWMLLALSAAIAHAEYYKLNLTRIGDNLYKESSTDIVIVTRHCYAHLYREDVLLRYEPYAIDNVIVLNDVGEYCEVKEIRDAVDIP